MQPWYQRCWRMEHWQQSVSKWFKYSKFEEVLRLLPVLDTDVSSLLCGDGSLQQADDAGWPWEHIRTSGDPLFHPTLQRV